MLTIDPDPARTIFAPAERQQTKVPLRFTSITRCHSSSGYSVVVPQPPIPAAFTSTSTRSSPSNTLATADASVTSTSTTWTPLSAASEAPSRSMPTTSAPASANPRAISRPSPLPAPVTTATLPSRRKSVAKWLDLCITGSLCSDRHGSSTRRLTYAPSPDRGAPRGFPARGHDRPRRERAHHRLLVQRRDEVHDLPLQQLPRQRLAPADGACRQGLGREGPSSRTGRPQDRERREHGSGADQLPEQHHPAAARRDPRRRRILERAQPDARARVQARHPRHLVRPDRHVSVRVQGRERLERDPAGPGGVDGEADERQGHRLHGPRPGRSPDLGADRERLQG